MNDTKNQIMILKLPLIAAAFCLFCPMLLEPEQLRKMQQQ